MMRSSGWHRQVRQEKSEAEMDEQAKKYFAHLWRTKGYAVIPVDDLVDWTDQGVVTGIAERLYGKRGGA